MSAHACLLHGLGLGEEIQLVRQRALKLAEYLVVVHGERVAEAFGKRLQVTYVVCLFIVWKTPSSYLCCLFVCRLGNPFKLPMSPRSLGSSEGRCTLMATVRPSTSIARCTCCGWDRSRPFRSRCGYGRETTTYPRTCAMDAEPSGLSSNSLNMTSIGSPSSRSWRMTALTTEAGMGSTASCSFWRRSVYCFGNMSTRVLITCPLLVCGLCALHVRARLVSPSRCHSELPVPRRYNIHQGTHLLT